MARQCWTTRSEGAFPFDRPLHRLPSPRDAERYRRGEIALPVHELLSSWIREREPEPRTVAPGIEVLPWTVFIARRWAGDLGL